MKNTLSNEYGHCDYCVCKEKDCAMIYNLYILKDYRKKGHAKELIQKAIKEIRATNYKKDIKVVAEPDDNSITKDALIKFYESMGLKIIKANEINYIEEND